MESMTNFEKHQKDESKYTAKSVEISIERSTFIGNSKFCKVEAALNDYLGNTLNWKGF